MRREFRVAICGYYGFGNLGDELLAAALLDALEESGVSRSAVLMLSGSPEDSARSHGVRTVSRWSPKDVFAALRKSETLLLGGGGLFQDATSRRSSFYYWGVVRLALLAGARPWCAGQSVGPFRTRTAALLARSAMRKCELRGVRDERSASLLSEWGLDSLATCDPVFSLPLSAPSSESERELLVNIRPWRGSLPRRTGEEAARFASARSLAITGLALAPEDVETMNSLRKEGVFPAERIVLLKADNWREEGALLFSRSVGTISMRFHASVLSLLFRRPLTAVEYAPKVGSLASEWGVPTWDGLGCLPEPRISADTAKIDEKNAEFSRVFSAMCAAVLRHDGKE